MISIPPFNQCLYLSYVCGYSSPLLKVPYCFLQDSSIYESFLYLKLSLALFDLLNRFKVLIWTLFPILDTGSTTLLTPHPNLEISSWFEQSFCSLSSVSSGNPTPWLSLHPPPYFPSLPCLFSWLLLWDLQFFCPCFLFSQLHCPHACQSNLSARWIIWRHDPVLQSLDKLVCSWCQMRLSLGLISLLCLRPLFLLSLPISLIIFLLSSKKLLHH